MKIGIIGGSGLDDPKFFQEIDELDVETPYGKPSSTLKVGKISDIEVVMLPDMADSILCRQPR